MPRQKSLMSVIRDLVQQEVRSAIQGVFGSLAPKTPAKSGRRRKARGKWRPGGPGRPPKAVADQGTEKTDAVARALVPKAKNARRRKARGKWRPGGPGRPPKAVALKAAASKAARKKK